MHVFRWKFAFSHDVWKIRTVYKYTGYTAGSEARTVFNNLIEKLLGNFQDLSNFSKY